MTTYNVSVPDNKNSFFLEFLELIGARYEKKQEISDSEHQNNSPELEIIPLEHLESIQRGLEQLKQGLGTNNSDVRKKALEICSK